MKEEIEKLNKIIDELREQKVELQDSNKKLLEENDRLEKALEQIIKYCSVLPKEIAIDDKNQLALYNIYHTAKQLIKN